MHLKRISFFLFLCSISLSSQTLTDVLGFTSNNPSGTARFESMGELLEHWEEIFRQ